MNTRNFPEVIIRGGLPYEFFLKDLPVEYREKGMGAMHCSFIGMSQNRVTCNLFLSFRDRENRSGIFMVRVCFDIENRKVEKLGPMKLLLSAVEVPLFAADGVSYPYTFTHNSVDYLLFVGWSKSSSKPFVNNLGVVKLSASATELGGNPRLLFSNKKHIGKGTGSSSIYPIYDKNNTFGGYELLFTKFGPWLKSEQRLEPKYRIYRAISHDLINWSEAEVVVPEVTDINKACKPVRVWDHILYSARGDGPHTSGYRLFVHNEQDYLKPSLISYRGELPEYCNNMQAYPSVVQLNCTTYLILFSGNQYGKLGGAWGLLQRGKSC